MEIRRFRPQDLPRLEALYPAAFPQEDLLPLVRDLSRPGEPVISLVAADGDGVVGHVAFTLCGVEGREDEVALLAPLAVSPSRQRSGIGAALFRARLDRLAGRRALVLGDPAYYSRLGFEREDGVEPPWPLPPEWRDAWQGLGGVEPPPVGRLRPPAFWMKRELWGP